MPEFSDPAQAAGLTVLSRILRIDPGLFALSLVPGPHDPASGLPGVRVSLPPATGQREMVGISTMRSDGWLTAADEPTLLRAGAAGGHVLVTLYWVAAPAVTQPPALRLERLNIDSGANPRGLPSTVGGALSPPSPPAAEVVAHIEGVGDIDGRFGDWVGQRGSGRAIEGFSLAPRNGVSPDDFEVRGVLGRDWLSPWLPGGRFCGSRGLALPLRGFCLRLRGQAAARFDFACFARFTDGSEAGPIGSEQICASASLAPLEAFQIGLRPRGNLGSP